MSTIVTSLQKHSKSSRKARKSAWDVTTFVPKAQTVLISTPSCVTQTSEQSGIPHNQQTSSRQDLRRVTRPILDNFTIHREFVTKKHFFILAVSLQSALEASSFSGMPASRLCDRVDQTGWRVHVLRFCYPMMHIHGQYKERSSDLRLSSRSHASSIQAY